MEPGDSCQAAPDFDVEQLVEEARFEPKNKKDVFLVSFLSRV